MGALSDNIKVLEMAFRLLNQRFFENTLSTPVITVQSSPKAYGHCTSQRVWRSNDQDTSETEGQGNTYFEINMSAEYLARPIADTTATLLHEMVHQYCAENGIQDTSRGGTYHNKKFKAEAEKRGLIIGFTKKDGHSPTEPGPELLDFINESEIGQLTFQRAFTTTSTKKKNNTRKYECPCCGQSVRATKEVNIYCGDCEEKMVCVTPEQDAGDESELYAVASCKR